jgi:hypothetical protein
LQPRKLWPSRAIVLRQRCSSENLESPSAAQRIIDCGRLSDARHWLARSVELRHAAGERYYLARTFERLAFVAAQRSEPELGLKLVGADERVHHDLGSRRTSPDLAFLERWLPSLRERVGASVAEALMSEGRALDLDDAVTMVLSGLDEQAPGARPHDLSVLTAREQEVAVLLARGSAIGKLPTNW